MNHKQKLRKLIKHGCVILIHKNDFKKLKEASKKSVVMDFFDGAEIFVDQSGLVKEGFLRAVTAEGFSVELSFEDYFT